MKILMPSVAILALVIAMSHPVAQLIWNVFVA